MSRLGGGSLSVRGVPRSRWFFRAAALAGVGSYVAVEAGWITTEVGRQPWIVYQVMQVGDAVNPVPAGTIWTMFGAVLVVYAVIAFFHLTLLLRLSARWQREYWERGSGSVGRRGTRRNVDSGSRLLLGRI